MRATWITSLIAGTAFGVALRLTVRTPPNALLLAVVLAVTLAVVMLWVAGLTHFREVRAERKKRGLGRFDVLMKRSDFPRFYFPLWGRMGAFLLGMASVSFVVEIFTK